MRRNPTNVKALMAEYAAPVVGGSMLGWTVSLLGVWLVYRALRGTPSALTEDQAIEKVINLRYRGRDGWQYGTVFRARPSAYVWDPYHFTPHEGGFLAPVREVKPGEPLAWEVRVQGPNYKDSQFYVILPSGKVYRYSWPEFSEENIDWEKRVPRYANESR